MFKLNFLLSKRIYILFFGLLLLTGCEKQSTPPSNEEPVVEKDGVVSIILEENSKDSTGHLKTQIIDTLFISEAKDSIWIRNAFPFSVPQSLSFTIFFEGKLLGMPNYIAVWYKYFDNDISGKKVPLSEIELLGPNQGLSLLSSIETKYNDQDSIKGFAFFMDFDNVHEGSGKLTIEGGTVKKIYSLDAKKHTIILNSGIKNLDFKLMKNTTRLNIRSDDYESFVDLKYDVIWLLQYKDQNDSFRSWATSRMGMGLSIEGTNREFRLTGFAPNFIH